MEILVIIPGMYILNFTGVARVYEFSLHENIVAFKTMNQNVRGKLNWP